MPYRSYNASARCLDDKRLGKQRSEVLQILKTLETHTGWVHHPAVKMWSQNPLSLIVYGKIICNEWINRGFRDNCLSDIEHYRLKFKGGTKDKPEWLKWPEFTLSHRLNLIRKHRAWYEPIFWDCSHLVPQTAPYVWPRWIDDEWKLTYGDLPKH